MAIINYEEWEGGTDQPVLAYDVFVRSFSGSIDAGSSWFPSKKIRVV